MNIGFKFLSALAFCLANTAAFGQIIAVPPMVQVSDLTGTLTVGDLSGLEKKVQALEHAKGAQLAVLIVPSTGDEDIEQYAHRVFETWHLGRKGIDDGVLLIIAKNDKHLRIEVGRGLEGAIPDISAKRIGSDVIAPLWKKGENSAALNAGVDALAKLITQEALPAASASPVAAPIPLWVFLGVIFGIGGLVCLFAWKSGKAPDSTADDFSAPRDRSDYFDPSPSVAAALATHAVLHSKAQSAQPRSEEDDSSSRSSSRRDEDDSSSGSSSSESSSWSGGGGESAGGGASSDL